MCDTYFPKLETYADFLDQNNLSFSVSSMVEFAKTSSTSLGDVTSRDSLIVLFFLVLFMRQLKGVLIPFFCSVGRTLGRSTHGAEWENENEERIAKFGEYVFRLIYHSACSIIGLYCFHDKPWWNQEQGGMLTVFVGHPNHAIEMNMTWYYMLQCAYNIEAMLSLIELSFIIKLQSPFSSKIKVIQSPVKIEWSPTCRGDFNEMFAHHIITNLLVIGSSYCRFTRIGSMVFMVHDISDVPVDLSKLANFMKWKITTVVCFILLVVVWAITRLAILPLVIVKGVFDLSHVMYLEGSMDVRHYKMYLCLFKGLFVAITSLQFFWFFLLVRILYRLVMKGERHDLTEHKQGEDQGVPVQNKNVLVGVAAAEKKKVG